MHVCIYVFAYLEISFFLAVCVLYSFMLLLLGPTSFIFVQYTTKKKQQHRHRHTHTRTHTHTHTHIHTHTHTRTHTHVYVCAQMPKIRTKRTKVPKGFEVLEETLAALDEKMREGPCRCHCFGFLFFCFLCFLLLLSLAAFACDVCLCRAYLCVYV